MSDLTDRLRALSRMEHSDHTIGNEAADEIDRLSAENMRLKTSWSTMAKVGSETADLNDKLAAERDHAVEQAAKNADEVLALRERVAVLENALERITRHFTKAPSTLADTEMRGMAHRVLMARAALKGEA